MNDDVGPRPFCDYRHGHEGDPTPYADWAYIGESGDYYVCDEHFQIRTPEGRRGWSRIA